MRRIVRNVSLTNAALLTVLLSAAAAVRANDPAPPHPVPMPAAAGVQPPLDRSGRKNFWSFKPVRMPELPAVRNASWPRNDLDRLVLARLEGAGLQPAPEADKPTLIRRATFIITGLPPTPEEVRKFLADSSPDAYEKLVDRLLASPHYGERWGRHWLDVARYAPGRISFAGNDDVLGDAAYRDYVVRAFNADKPYNQFVTEQIAGDLLPPAANIQAYFDQITAPAFLSLGPWFDMETDPNRLRLEMIDEMIGTTSQAFLGLSMQCARCHDHKFDPISTEDYYALGGIFRSTRLVAELNDFWRDGRVRQLRPLAMPQQVAANDAISQKIAEQVGLRNTFLAEHHAALLADWKKDEAGYRAAAEKIGTPWIYAFEAENFDGQDNLRIAQLMFDGKGVDVIETQTPQAQWVKYKFEVPETSHYRLEAFYSGEEPAPLQVTANADTIATQALAEPTGGSGLEYRRWAPVGEMELRKGLNFLRLTAKGGSFPRIDKFRLIRIDADFDARIDAAARDQHLHVDVLKSFVKDPANPWPTAMGIEPFLSTAEKATANSFTDNVTALKKQIVKYSRIVAVTDEPTCVDIPVHIKGGVYATSEKPVRRGVPRIFDGLVETPNIPADQSGRLQLAQWLTDPANPLVARVMVNRIWQGNFGRGLVASSSDFGARGERPSYPELLDYLAATFVRDGWSIKTIQRLILTSSTFRQSSQPGDSSAAERDPENTLLSHFSPRRLEVEAIYDAMRSTTNMIPRQPPGPLDVDKSGQRMMYVLTNRRSPPGLSGEVRKMFTLFDYDLSAVPVAARPTSTTPAQALFFLNNPLPQYMAERFAARLLKMDRLDDAKRVETASMLALGHVPTSETTAKALQYIELCQSEDGLNREQAWTRFCKAMYATAEFRYVQ